MKNRIIRECVGGVCYLAMLGSFFILKLPLEGAEAPGSVAEWNAGRKEDALLDSLVRLLSLRPLADECNHHLSKKGLRYLAVSSWGYSVFTVVFVGNNDLRFDGRKSTSGYILILDEGGWKNDERILSSERNVYVLKNEQVDRLLKAAGVDKADLLEKWLRETGRDARIVIDGGPSVFEWVNGKDVKTVFWPSMVERAPEEIMRMIKAFYDLLPPREERAK